MKKIYLLLAASFSMAVSAFAEPLAIDPAGTYQMKVTVEAAAGGNIYAKAFAGVDNSFIELAGPNDVGEGVKLFQFQEGTNPFEGSYMKPYGTLDAIDRILFTFPWTNPGKFTVKDIQILDAEGNNLMDGVTLVSIENTHIAAGVTASCGLTAEGDGFSVELSAQPTYGWGAQFLLMIDKDNAGTAVAETDAFEISASNGTVCCDGDFRIYDLAGVEVTGQNGSLNGNYIVVANGESVVVNVK